MNNDRFYEVIILDSYEDGFRQILKVLFYWSHVENALEPENQKALREVFLRSYFDHNADVVQIVPIDLDYFHCVTGKEVARE